MLVMFAQLCDRIFGGNPLMGGPKIRENIWNIQENL